MYGMHVWHIYQESQQLMVDQQQLQKFAEDTSAVLVAHEKKVQEIDTSYKTLEKRYAKLKASIPKCTLPAPVVELWNDSSKGVSADSGTAAGKAGEATSSEVTLDEAIQNKIEWDNWCHKIEEKYDSIIDWHHKTYEEE